MYFSLHHVTVLFFYHVSCSKLITANYTKKKKTCFKYFYSLFRYFFIIIYKIKYYFDFYCKIKRI